MKGTVIYFDLGNTLVWGPADNRQPFEDVVDTIEELWWRGYKIGLLSDQPPGTTEAGVRAKLTNYGLDQARFDVITISSEFDPPVSKPAALIFETAVNKAGHLAPSDRTVFVTETLCHVEAARALGWRAIHKPFQAACTPASGECIEDLSELLLTFPRLPVDILIRDAPTDPGDDLYAGSGWWNSPDLWIRHQEDGVRAHQGPEHGQDNWFYTRLRNRGEGIARFSAVTYAIREWAGTQFVYPHDYWPFTAQAFATNLDSDESAVIHAKWNAADVPPANTHACWLAMAWVQDDIPAADAHVWEHNNLAQKNLTVVDLNPGDSADVPIRLGSRFITGERYYTLEIVRSKSCLDLPVSLVATNRKILGKLVSAGAVFIRGLAAGEAVSEGANLLFLEDTRLEMSRGPHREGRMTFQLRSGSVLELGDTMKREPTESRRDPGTMVPARLVEDEQGGAEILFASARASGIGVALGSRQLVSAVLKFTVPKDATPGERLEVDLIQRDGSDRIVGGVAIHVNVRARSSRKAHAGRKPRKATRTPRPVAERQVRRPGGA